MVPAITTQMDRAIREEGERMRETVGGEATHGPPMQAVIG